MKKKNIAKVLKVFEENYKEIPLERYSNDPLKTLISTMLSSRTNDDTTYIACERLFEVAPDIKSLYNLPQETISKLIYPVGFYRVKAKNIKIICEILNQKFCKKVPSSFKDLTFLPGVGRKTANLVLNRAFGIDAIAVDTHLHKISNILGWVNTKTPLSTEKELQKIVPRKDWHLLNKLFVSIGRQYRSRNKLMKFLIENNLI